MTSRPSNAIAALSPNLATALSIVAGIVQQHHGEVLVEDSPLGGARVGFTLPMP